MGFSFGVGLAVTVLILLIEHWLPWKRRPSDLTRYALGSGGILAGLAVWLGEQGQWATLLMIGAFYAAGGLATFGAYIYDQVRNAEQRLRIHERQD
jgi:hypothetical protein